MNDIYVAVWLGPALLLLFLFMRMDAKRPEPPGAIRNVVLLGVALCLPAALVQIGLEALLGDENVAAGGHFLEAFLVASFTEESLKLACVLLYLWRKPHFDEVMDGILYTAAASLGFAALENVLYVGNDLGLGVARALTAVPMHALASGLMGYFVGRGRMAPGQAPKWIAGGLVVGVGVHGFYDWALMSEGSYGTGEANVGAMVGGVAIVLVGSAVALRFAWRHALALDDGFLGSHPRPLPPKIAPAPKAAATALPSADADAGSPEA